MHVSFMPITQSLYNTEILSQNTAYNQTKFPHHSSFSKCTRLSETLTHKGSKKCSHCAGNISHKFEYRSYTLSAIQYLPSLVRSARFVERGLWGPSRDCDIEKEALCSSSPNTIPSKNFVSDQICCSVQFWRQGQRLSRPSATISFIHGSCQDSSRPLRSKEQNKSFSYIGIVFPEQCGVDLFLASYKNDCFLRVSNSLAISLPTSKP